MFSFDEGSLLTRLASKWARKVMMALTIISFLGTCPFHFERFCLAFFDAHDYATAIGLYICFVALSIALFGAFIDWLLDEAWHRGESRLAAFQEVIKKKTKIKSKNLYLWYRALAVYLQIVLIIILNASTIKQLGGFAIIDSSMSELQKTLALWCSQGNMTLTLMTASAALLGVFGATVAFIDRYNKALKYAISHSLLRTELRDYADVLLNVCVLAGFGFVAPFWAMLLPLPWIQVMLICFLFNFAYLSYTFIVRRKISTNKWILFLISVISLTSAICQGILHGWLFLNKHSFWALLGSAVPIWSLCETIRYLSHRFVQQGDSIVMVHNRKLYIGCQARCQQVGRCALRKRRILVLFLH